MTSKSIIQEQMNFYKNGLSGCYFASVAAKNPHMYGWHQSVIDANVQDINESLVSAINNPNISTLSLIVPKVCEPIDLINLTQELIQVPVIQVESQEYNSFTCLGVRVLVGDYISWVTGFGNFSFLPKTRQAPYTEIALRVKPRPNYEWVLKEAPKMIIHLADLDMLGLSKAIFEKLWKLSFRNTERVLGHKPDLLSAAKTTFSIPNELLLA
jgi:hypothetical protein